MTRDDIIRLMREVGNVRITSYKKGTLNAFSEEQLERFAVLVAAAEREACALACENIAKDTYGMTKLREYGECAAAIRARGEK